MIYLTIFLMMFVVACSPGSKVSQEEILRSGVPMQAIVTSIKDMGSHDDVTSDVLITVSVTPEGGEPYPAEIRGTFARKDLTTYVAGTTVNVKVLENDKTAVAIVGALVNPRER
ncbi:MAG: hypothetical protein EHM43_04400 [Ignavibacteriae bacterium]|nr:MAG: hypothetical protein EHM43_04400 [Ignavibacteriota bacterium]